MLKKLILTLSLSFLAFADENASKEVIVKFIQDNAYSVRLINPIEAPIGFLNFINKKDVIVENLKDILELDFDFEYTNNRLLEIPKEIKYLINLENLYLNDNLIEELPSEIGELENLIDLELNNNQLKKLPKEIGNLKNLAFLYLNNNLIKELPSEIGNLKKLNTLKLGNNKLINIPKEITDLPLSSLVLNDNNLKELPSEIENLTSLIYLKLNNNQLEKIPNIGKLINLEYLFLNNNNLKEIPKEIENLENLKELYLSNNNLKELPKGVGNICSEVRETLNPSRQIPPLDPCIIDVESNKLSYLPQEIAKIGAFYCSKDINYTLKFNNNYFDLLPISFKKIKFALVFTSNWFWECKKEGFEDLGYKFYSLLIDYSFEGNKTIAFKPILGDDFNITSYLWSFGDGNYSNEKNPTYTYPNYGDYNVTLTLNSGEYNASKLISLYPRVLELKKGWNMITSPSKDDINATLFEILWSYEDGSWDNNHSFLKPSIGYWVKLQNDLNYSYNGEIYKLPNYKIKNGWNFLGSGEKYFKETNQTIYQFKNNSWIINPNEVKTGDGFWIKEE